MQSFKNPQTLIDSHIDSVMAALNDQNYFGKRIISTKDKAIDKASEASGYAPSFVREVAEVNSDRMQKFFSDRDKAKAVALEAEERAKREAERKALIEQAENTGSVETRLQNLPEFKGSTYIITSAQDTTSVHAPFLQNLEAYAVTQEAEILATGFTYNTGNGRAKKGEEWYVPAVEKYLLTDDVWLIKDKLLLAASANILPTASHPINGFETYALGADLIIGHAKMHLKSLDTPKGERAIFHYSTGAVTTRNYRKEKAGQRAEALHSFSALIVQIDDDGQHHVRQLTADESGTFYDYDPLDGQTYMVQGGKVFAGVRPEAVNLGDVHSEKMDNQAFSLTCGILSELRPKYLLLHDVYDQESRNHHNRADCHFLAMMQARGATVEGDLIKAYDTVTKLASYCTGKAFIVESNHDLALDVWLVDPKYKPATDPVNALLYHRLHAAHYAAIRETGVKHLHNLQTGFIEALKLAGRTPDFSKLHFLSVDDKCVIAGVDCSQHGHIGAGGARGSAATFAKQAMPTNTGHTHKATILDGNFTAGVMGENFGYNKGLSAWSVSHIITWPNGGRQIITLM